MAAYDAFISYSHAKDKPIASALQSVVQTLGKPWYRRRALRVFRDASRSSSSSYELAYGIGPAYSVRSGAQRVAQARASAAPSCVR